MGDSAASHQVLAEEDRIYQANVFEQCKTPFDLSGKATAQKYRFVDAESLLERNSLDIYEYKELPSIPYTTVSYVWDGVSKQKDAPPPVGFSVQGKGKLAGDPITIEVIQLACRAAVARGTKLLWVDRLCLVQSDENDISWQFKVMHNIYAESRFCVVIPGGLIRLTTLHEVTPWINRGWTLQEAVAPPNVEVMFLWDRGGLWAKPVAGESSSIGEITPITNSCAIAPLGLLLDCCITGSLHLTKEPTSSDTEKLKDAVTIFGVRSDQFTSETTTALPSVAMLATILSKRLGRTKETEDRYYHCLWKCMLMRTTRDPCDLIFSAMGLFDVDPLESKDFYKNDCVLPAIALAKRILDKGRGATWLGASFHAPPCPQLSSFSTFPRVTARPDVRSLIRIPLEHDKSSLIKLDAVYVESSRLVLNEYVDPEILPMPRGSMDSDGYLTIEGCASIPVTPITGITAAGIDAKKDWKQVKRIADTGKLVWEASNKTQPDQDGYHQYYAVLLGCFFTYDPAFTPVYDNDNIRGFIIEKTNDYFRHAPGDFHIRSYFMLTVAAASWVSEWRRRTFCIGGPDSLYHLYPDTITEVQSGDIALPQLDKGVLVVSEDLKSRLGGVQAPLMGNNIPIVPESDPLVLRSEPSGAMERVDWDGTTASRISASVPLTIAYRAAQTRDVQKPQDLGWLHQESVDESDKSDESDDEFEARLGPIEGDMKARTPRGAGAPAQPQRWTQRSLVDFGRNLAKIPVA